LAKYSASSATLLYWVTACIPLAIIIASNEPKWGLVSACAVLAGLIAARLSDRVSRREALRLAHQAAFRDDLTGLPNRRLFLDELREALAKPIERERATSVFFIDLDNFKTINDTLGHSAGDRVLVEMARRLKKTVPAEHTLARIGGDEMTVLVRNAKGRQEVVDLAQQIMEEFARPISINGDEVWANASIGIVIASMPRPSPDDFLAMADTALYNAKAQGKGQFILFEPSLPRPTRRQLSLDADLRSAVEKDELVLHFQPIADLNTMTVAGFEALIRWQHPRYGLLQPNEFIPLAEESGVIRTLGNWIIEKGCEQISVWQTLSGLPLVLSINLSVLQFRQRNVLTHLARSSSKVGLRPGSLQLEITESILMENDPATLKNLNDLHAQGFSIAVDDFGVGYSSLGYLKYFDIDVLKLDRAFLANLEDPRSEALLRGAVQLGRSLDVTVVAEGIESEEQLLILRSAGCHQGQGFLLGKPMTEREVTELLLTNSLLKPYFHGRRPPADARHGSLYWNLPQDAV
jgi:diguanylate cyclase (GGDEF)-like protein